MPTRTDAEAVETLLIALARAAWHALDNGESRTEELLEGEPEEVTVLSEHYATELGRALDALDALPDEPSGLLIETGPAKAERILLTETAALRAKLAAAEGERDRLREVNGLKPHGEAITFRYTNWRGETATRTALPAFIFWDATEWHPEPQWLMRALDVDKGEVRDFALRDCDFTASPAPAVPAREAALTQAAYDAACTGLRGTAAQVAATSTK